MKLQRIFILLATLVAASGITPTAMAQTELAKSKNCLACHATNTKLVGPAFKDIAAKYAEKKGAQEQLARKIMQGGGGVWGPMAMPANPQVNEVEARQLAQWVLAQK